MPRTRGDDPAADYLKQGIDKFVSVISLQVQHLLEFEIVKISMTEHEVICVGQVYSHISEEERQTIQYWGRQRHPGQAVHVAEANTNSCCP